MKLDLFTLMYNESDIIPYIVDYWKKIRETIDLHVTVFDNLSTDDSVKMLSGYDWITIRYFISDGQNDVIHQKIKNDCWRDSKADFVIICDFDEIFWGDLLGELEYMKENGYNVMGCKWYAFCGENVPVYTEGKYLHELVKKGYKQYINHTPNYGHLGKFLLFDPNLVNDIQWSVGQHILYSVKPAFNLYVSDKVVNFHVNKGLSEDYFVNKRKKMGKRLSDTNKKYGMAVEYLYPEEKTRKEYREYVKNSVDIEKK